MEYNGFKNKATWLVSLWLNNTESTATYWSNVAREQARRYDFMAATQNVADRLEDCFQGMAADTLVSCPMFTDILQSALADVDWDHIAQNLVDGVTVES
jgi:hypothetical protein